MSFTHFPARTETHPESIAFVGGTSILPESLIEDSVVICKDGKIEAVGRAGEVVPAATVTQIDITGCFLAPGFVDLHVHGGHGADFMDGTCDAFVTACTAHARHGTTTIFPTTSTGSSVRITNMLNAYELAKSTEVGPLLGGVHLYGPYFAPDKVGCHPPSGRREPSPEEYAVWLDRSVVNSNIVRIATCAAELAGAAEFYRCAAQHDCLITCGHSNSSWGEMQAAFDAGMRHVDHFWCAMSSVPSLRPRFGVPMQASMTEFVLMNKEMSTEVIADGWHLSPELLEFAFRMLGPDRLCLVTDCNRAMDLPAGDYHFGHATDGSIFTSDGQVGWTLDRKSLASAVVGMDSMVRTMHAVTSASLPEVIRMASLTPAKLIGMADAVGSITRGNQADLLVLSHDLQIQRVYKAGIPIAISS